MSDNANRQICQRTIAGLLTTAGITAVALLAAQGHYSGWPRIVSGFLAVGGCCLFGYFALRGRLPGKHLSKASAAMVRATTRHDV